MSRKSQAQDSLRRQKPANQSPVTATRSPKTAGLGAVQRAVRDPSSLTPGAMLAVQRTAGNQAALQLLGDRGAQVAEKAKSTSSSPIPEGVRSKMESSFGHDFSDVRVHVGNQAPALGALAYTQGSDIHFAPGQYNPTTSQGQQVLGHELTHVVQQRAGRVSTPQGKGAPINADHHLESEADHLGAKAARGEVVHQASPASGGGIQRKGIESMSGMDDQRKRGGGNASSSLATEAFAAGGGVGGSASTNRSLQGTVGGSASATVTAHSTGGLGASTHTGGGSQSSAAQHGGGKKRPGER